MIEKRRKNLPAWQGQSTVAIANVCKGVELIVVMFSILSAKEPQKLKYVGRRLHSPV